jgi:hypothetical protein
MALGASEELMAAGTGLRQAEIRASEIWPLFTSLLGLPSLARNAVLLWGLTLFGLPLVITELLAFSRGVEFVDLLDGLSWPARALLYVTLFYAVVFFAGRSQNEFIYFQF